MTIIEFPPLESADKSGLLAIGGDLEVDSLLLAYRSGIFPWPFDNKTLAWFSPPKRTVMFFDNFHVSRSLQREIKKAKLDFRINHDFEKVVTECAASRNRKKEKGTWITKKMIAAYVELHKAGYAQSFECYEQDEIVSGIYGVAIGGMFAGESMFYKKTNASKICFFYMVEFLKSKGLTWIDCQVMNPHLESLGATEIKRTDYMILLKESLGKGPWTV